MKYVNNNYSFIMNKMGQHVIILTVVSLTLVISIVNKSLHWPSTATVMNSTVLTFNGSCDVTEEVKHNPIPYIKHAMENNHRFTPFSHFALHLD